MLVKSDLAIHGVVSHSHYNYYSRSLFNYTATDAPIHLGRTPRDECRGVELVCSSCQPFVNEQIIARESTTFQARIGPSGNERGYMGITGNNKYVCMQ